MLEGCNANTTFIPGPIGHAQTVLDNISLTFVLDNISLTFIQNSLGMSSRASDKSSVGIAPF